MDDGLTEAEAGKRWCPFARAQALGMPYGKKPDLYREAVSAARAAGIAVQPRSPREVSQAQRRLLRLYSEPHEGFWRYFDVTEWLVAIVTAFIIGLALGRTLFE